MSEATRDVATWRIILAFVLDALTAFFVFGYLVATLFGGRTEGGFSLSGWPAFLMLGLSSRISCSPSDSAVACGSGYSVQ
jgi:hypothetical protein